MEGAIKISAATGYIHALVKELEVLVEPVRMYLYQLTADPAVQCAVQLLVVFHVANNQSKRLVRNNSQLGNSMYQILHMRLLSIRLHQCSA